MSIAIKNFYGVNEPVHRIQDDSNLRMLLLICGLIAVPSVALTIVLTGWIQYVFALVVAVNIAVPVMAYLSARHPPAPMPDEEFGISRPQISLSSENAPAGKVSG